MGPCPAETRKGFVDLQVNGYLGVDFSSPELLPDQVHRLTGALASAGTVAYCATLVTSDLPTYERNLKLLARVCVEPGVRDHLLGVHLEGPYLSSAARGAHAAEKMRRPDPNEFDRMQEWADGRIALLTLAPEIDGALSLISHVRKHYRTVVALGHHMAPRETIHRAVEAGATLATHLGNGCPNMLPRHDNILVYQLAHDGLTAGLITDGHHVPEDFVRVAFRCKGPERIFVVSDCAPIAGYPPGVYETLGHTVRLSASGRIDSMQAAHLVGSGCSMAECMRWLRSLGFLSDEELWKVGLENPLAILGVGLSGELLADIPDMGF